MGLSPALWTDVDAQTGEGDLSGDAERALDSLQLITARTSEEMLEFNLAFAELTPEERADARDEFGGIIDDFLDDIEENPSGLDSARLLLLKTNVRDEFPDEVRDEFDDYIDAMIELEDQVADLGDAMDDLQADGFGEPYLTEFGLLFVF